MANEIIRPVDLPDRPSPVASEKMVVDNGSTVAGATIASIVDAGRPLASQVEAEAGVNATKAMTPLTTKQAIDAQAVTSITAGDNVSIGGTSSAPVISATAELASGDKGDVSVITPTTQWRINRQYDTVSGLLADTGTDPIGMGYIGSGASVIVQAGDSVDADEFKYTVAAESAPDANITTSGGVALYLRRNADLTVYSEQAGVTAATTSAAAINKMLQSALAAGAHTVKFAPGEYEPDARIDWPVGLLEIDGQGSHWTRNISSGSGWNNVLLRYVDTLEVLPALASDIDCTTEVIEFATPHGLAVNDIIGFRVTTDSSLNTYRAFYYDGQQTRVREIVSDTEITVFDVIDPRGVLKAFPAATTEVFRYRSRSNGVMLRNIEMHGDLNPFGICRFEGISDFELENIKASGGEHTTLGVGFSAYGRSEGLRLNHFAPTVGNQYGIMLDNTSHFRAFDTVAYATRHAIAQGGNSGFGAAPVRGNDFFGVQLGSTASFALDFGHGNVLDCSVSGGTSSGITLGGDNNRADLDVISAPKENLGGNQAVYMGEMHSMNHSIKAGRMIISGDGTVEGGGGHGNGIFGFGGSAIALSADTVDGGVVSFEVGTIDARRWVTLAAPFTRWRNRGFTGRWGVRLRIGQIIAPVEADWFNMGNVSGTGAAILDLGSVAPDRFDPSGSPTHGWNAADRGVFGAAVVTDGDISVPPLKGSVADAGATIAAGTSRRILVTGFAGLTNRDSVSFGVSGALGGNFSVSADIASNSAAAITVANNTAGPLPLNALTWYAYVEKRP